MSLSRIVSGIGVLVEILSFPLWASDINWSDPVDLSTPVNTIDPPQVAVNSAGNAVAVWSEFNGGNRVIPTAKLPFGGVWATPTIVLDTANSVDDPRVAMDADGNIITLWKLFSGPNTFVQASTLPVGGTTWTDPVDVSAVIGSVGTPQLALNEHGKAIAIWQHSTGGIGIIQASRLAFGGVWTTPTDLSNPGQDASFPQVAVDPAGNAVAVWERSNGTNIIIQAATFSSEGTTWTTPVNLSNPGQDARFPQVAVDSAGNAVAVWQRSDGTNTIIQATTLPFGAATWTTPVNLSDPGQDASSSQVKVDPAGNAVAVWQRSDGTNTIIQAATFSFGGATWTTAKNLSSPGQNATRPQIAVDTTGNAVAVWQRSDGTNTIIQAATLPFGGETWATPVDLSDPGQDSSLPQVAFNNAFGSVAVVWKSIINSLNDANIQASVEFVQAASGIAIFPPQAAVGRQHANRFAMQTEYFNQLDWTASTSSVISYRIYRNGTLIAELPPTQLSYRDHARQKGVADTYQVTAIGLSNVESSAASIVIR
jgi:hypothetical protein